MWAVLERLLVVADAQTTKQQSPAICIQPLHLEKECGSSLIGSQVFSLNIFVGRAEIMVVEISFQGRWRQRVTAEVEVVDKVKVWEGVGRRRGVESIGRVADRPVWPQWQAVAAASLDSTVIGKLDRQIHQQLPPAWAMSTIRMISRRIAKKSTTWGETNVKSLHDRFNRPTKKTYILQSGWP